jgi:Haemolymph juvenile hormone binding protein (JHBP)
LKFDVLVSFPKLEIKGKYDLKLLILNTPFKSKGDIILKLENYRARVTMKASKYTKDGTEYIKFENFAIKIIRGNVKLFKLTNLFNGQKSLEEAANTLFINNSDFFLVNIYPQLEKSLAEHFTKIANEITGEASLDELFPK